MHLLSIEIWNFQTHDHFKHVFQKNVFGMVGPSDFGKSAIVRALTWVLFNRPKGDDFRSWNGEDTKVVVKINGHTITREKGSNGNRYILDDLNPFTGFGIHVPEPIAKVVNMDLDLNIQGQHNSVFLLNMKSLAVAKYINELVNIDIIDFSIREIAKDLRKVTGKLKDANLSLFDTKEELRKYKKLKSVSNKIDEVEMLEDDVASKFHTIELLSECITEIDSCTTLIKALKERVSVEKDINECLCMIDENIAQNETISELTGIIDSISEIEEILQSNSGEEMLPVINATLSLLDEHDELYTEITDVLELLTDVKTTVDNVAVLSQNITEAEIAFKKDMPDECPLCGQGVGNE